MTQSDPCYRSIQRINRVLQAVMEDTELWAGPLVTATEVCQLLPDPMGIMQADHMRGTRQAVAPQVMALHTPAMEGP